MKSRFILAILLSLVIFTGIIGCGEDEDEVELITPDPVDVNTIKASNENGQIKLTWQIANKAVEYRIERSDKRDGDYKDIGSTMNPTFVDTNVKHAQTYFYKIISESKDEIQNDQVQPFPWTYKDEPKLSVVEAKLDFGSSEKSKTIEIANTGTGELTWDASVDKDWISLDQTSETISTEKSIVKVTVARGDLDPGDHQATITITSKPAEAGEAKISVVVSKGCDYTLVVDAEELDFGETEEQLIFTISNEGTGTLAWSVKADENWVSIDPTEGKSNTAEITVKVNRKNLPPKESYFATITVETTCEPNPTNQAKQSEVIEVKMQIPPELEIVTRSLNFGENLDSLPIVIKNAGGGVLEWWLSTEDDWIIAPVDRNGTVADEENTVTIKAERDNLPPPPPEEREGLIIVKSNGGDGKITVTIAEHCAPKLSVEPPALDFSTEDSLELTISNAGTCKLEWEALPDKPWISLSSTSGTDSEIVKVEVDRKEASSTGNIKIKSKSNGDEKNISVTVLGGILVAYPEVLHFGEATSSEKLTIENVGKGLLIWETDPPAWITCRPPNGNIEPDGKSTITVEVERTSLELGENPAFIKITSNGGDKNVTAMVTKVCLVNGTVIDSRSDREIGGADIISSDGSSIQTDSRGEFSLSIKDPGRYKINVSMPKYIGSEKDITVDRIGNPISVKILLKPLPRVLKTIRDSATPFESPTQIAITSDDASAYVTNNDDGTVSVIDVFTDRILKKVDVGDEPIGVAANPNTNVREVYVANSASDNISIIDTTTNEEKAGKIPVGRFPVDLVVSSDGRTLYVANRLDKNVSIVDLEKRQQIGELKIGTAPEGITLTPDDIYLYSANFQDNTVSVFDVRSKTRVNGDIKVGAEPTDIIVSKNSKYVYVVNRLDGSLSIIDIFSNVALPPIEMDNGLGVSGIVAITERDGSEVVLVTNSFESNVSAIDISTRQSVSDIIPVGSSPLGIVATSDGRKIYVANSGDDSVSVLGY